MNPNTQILRFVWLIATLTPVVAQRREELPSPTTPSSVGRPLPTQGENGPAASPGDNLIEAVVEEDTVTRVDGDEPNFAPRVTWPATESDANRLDTLLGNPYTLAFRRGAFTPTPGFDPALVKRINTAGRAFGFIMIKGRMAPYKMRVLESLGIKLLGWHTWQSVKADIPATALSGLYRLTFVHWVGTSKLSQRMCPQLANALATAPETRKFDIVVNLFDSDLGPRTQYETQKMRATTGGGEHVDTPTFAAGALRNAIPNGEGQRELEALGFEFQSYDDAIFGMWGRATKAQILRIIALNRVVAVDLRPAVKGTDDQAMGMISQDRVRGTYPGTNVPVGVIDSGVNTTPTHTDLIGKMFLGFSTVPGKSAFADNLGHGTHVLGTIAGRGIVDSRYRGAAPALGQGGGGDRIFIGRYLDDNNNGVGDPAVLYDAFRKPQLGSPAPRIVNNSWGGITSTGFNGTGSLARSVDDYVYRYRQSYVFASGNKDGVPNYWAATPADAKNVISVGALFDEHSATRYPGAATLFTRRETVDGRRKPEVAAPGQTITSLKINSATGYVNGIGTSMAAPQVSGVLASLLDRNPAFYSTSPAACRASLAVAARFGFNGAGFDTKQGFGCVNSAKMNGLGTTRTVLHKGTITSPSAGSQDFFVTFPAYATDIKVVMVYIEAQASSNAAQAVTDQLRLWGDRPPYSQGFSGEWRMQKSTDNVVFVPEAPTSWAGERVRFRVQATALRARQRVDFAVAIKYHQNPKGSLSLGILSNSVSTGFVKPGETVKLTSTLDAQTDHDEFNHALIYFNSPSSWTNTRIDRTGADGVQMSYVDNSHISSPYPQLGIGPNTGFVVGQGSRRSVAFTLRAPAIPGEYTLYTRARLNAILTAIWSNGEKVCVDGDAPLKIGSFTGLQARTWYPMGGTIGWDQAVDKGCAGVRELKFTLSVNGPVEPSGNSGTLPPGTKSTPFIPVVSGTNLYFGIRAYDRADNAGPASYVGPIWVDLEDPVLTNVSTDAPKVSTLSGRVKVAGTDSHSGLEWMRFSNDGRTWSSRVAYTTGFRVVSLEAYGGNAAEGQKLVYAQLIDRVGNVSNVKRVAFQYLNSPTITSTTTAQRKAVDTLSFRVLGTGFDETERVEFGSQTIDSRWTGSHDNWYPGGSFRVLSDGVMQIFPPQAMRPGNYRTRAFNGTSFSNTVDLTIVKNTASILRTSSKLNAGAKQTIFVTAAGQAGTVGHHVILASVLDTPSILPGIYDFDIGAGFSQFVLFPAASFDGHGVSALTFPTTAAFQGVKAYFQSGYLDPTPNVVWPMPTSDVWSTTYQ